MTTTISDSQPTQLHSGFPTELPADITFIIFSYLDQQDCLNCMAVCRAWYDIVPHCAQLAWESVRFHPRDFAAHHQRREKCLGSHVKTVVLDSFLEQQLYDMMQQLLDWGCAEIHSLEITNSSTAMDQDMFLRQLESLSAKMKQLKVTKHNSNIPLLHILGACPRLTHFTFQPTIQSYTTHAMYDQEPVTARMLSPTIQFSTVQYLFLDALMDKQQRLEPVLRRCPNLRYLVCLKSTACTSIRHQTNAVPICSYTTTTVHLDELLYWCPRIVHFEANCGYRILDKCYDGWPVEEAATEETGLRSILVCEEHGVDRIAPHLIRNQHSLRELSLGEHELFPRNLINWSPIFGILYLNNLQTLVCDMIHFDTASMVTLLNHCPVLHTLIVETAELVVEQSQLKQLDIKPHLRTFHGFYLFDRDPCTLLLVKHFPGLERLILWDNVLDLSKTLRYLPEVKHMELHNIRYIGQGQDDPMSFYESKLESIQMGNATYAPMLWIATIPTLERISIAVDEYLCAGQVDNLCHFARLLAGTVVEELELLFVARVPFAALQALGDLPLLKRVVVTGPQRNRNSRMDMDKSGLVQMLRSSTSMVHVSCNKMVVTDGLKVYSPDEVVSVINSELPWYTVSINQYDSAKASYSIRITRK
ncbi:hypothetical protein BJV82DRAFT_666346 [Fennellomyces sp. T-0311]|nr:hypothetical protein BJV82DRAFT_666346 [Fennellomyces sp. T-0311]